MTKEISGSRARQPIQPRNSKKFFIVFRCLGIVKLRAAIPTNIAVIPGNYVIRITLRTSVHYAALQT